MSRRNSRQNPIEYDPLEEFENFKRKFLLINKHITKMNSGLNTKVEELNTQLNCLYVENLRLRTINVSLSVQLKQEREKSQKLMTEAESAATHFMKQMGSLRKTYATPTISPHSVQQQSQQPKAQRPTTPPPRRISRSPAFNQIHEVHSSEEEDRAAALATERPQSSLSIHSRLPRPISDAAPHEAPGPWYKKTSRRMSGYLEGLARPPSPSPGSPVTAHLKALSARMDEEDLETETEDMNNVQESLPDLPPLNSTSKEQSSQLFTPVIEDSEDLPTPTPTPVPRPKPAKKATGLRRVGLLKDMTNSSNFDQNAHPAKLQDTLPEHYNPSGLPSENIYPTHIDTPALPAQSLPSMHSAAQSLPALSTYSVDEYGDDPSASGRSCRARKSINYAEPSLKVKMRKPDGASNTKPKRKKSSLARSTDGETTDADAGADGDAENDISSALGLNGNCARRRSAAVTPVLKPLEETRRHSIAA